MDDVTKCHLCSRVNSTNLKCMSLFHEISNLGFTVSHLNERILRDVLATIKRQTSSSSIMAFFNTGDRIADITDLVMRLSNAERSIMVSRYRTSYDITAQSKL